MGNRISGEQKRHQRSIEGPAQTVQGHTTGAGCMQVLGVNIDQRSISKIEHNDCAVTDFELACFCKALQCTEQDLLQDFYENLNE